MTRRGNDCAAESLVDNQARRLVEILPNKGKDTIQRLSTSNTEGERQRKGQSDVKSPVDRIIVQNTPGARNLR